jgi:hypothetical protein
MHVGDRHLQMHMLHWKRNSLRALWMGQNLERASLFCRRFCPAWLESEDVHPGERDSYSAFPLLWQHTTRAWLRGGSKTVSCLQSVATLGNQSNCGLNKVQAHLAGHLCWFSILAWSKPDASLCSEIPPLFWTIYQGSNTQDRRGQGKQNQSGELSSCKSWSCVIDTQALNYELNLYQSDTVKDKHMIVDPSQLNVLWLEMETVPFIDSDAASVFKPELSSPTCRAEGKKCVLLWLLAEFDNLGNGFSTR